MVHQLEVTAIQFLDIAIMLHISIFGLSFERPDLIKGLNLMIAKSVKNCGFHGFWKTADFRKPQISEPHSESTKTADFYAKRPSLPGRVTLYFFV